MRTPKIEALHRLIDWLNNRPENKQLIKLGIDSSAISSNSWLSGFIEADGNFYSGINLNSKNIVNSVKCYMRISQRKYYHITIQNNNYTNSYLPIMEEIKKFLSVSQLIVINRNRNNFIELGYEIRTVKKKSCDILIDYLTKYPLFSSKHLDYLNWLNIIEVQKESKNKTKTIEYSNFILKLKKNMNTSRTIFNWKHLDNFYVK